MASSHFLFEDGETYLFYMDFFLSAKNIFRTHLNLAYQIFKSFSRFIYILPNSPSDSAQISDLSGLPMGYGVCYMMKVCIVFKYI